MASGKQHRVRRQRSRPTEDTGDERLPYRIELWDGDTVDRILALAENANLARAIYAAAATEYPGRVVVLSRGFRVIARNADYEA